jgi:hypothetical protein
VCTSLIKFCPPPEGHDFPGASPTSPSGIRGQISIEINWPGHLVGCEGLVGWGVKEEEAKNAFVAIFGGQHSFYAMARKTREGNACWRAPACLWVGQEEEEI